MKVVGTEEFEARTAALLAEVKAGETVQISEAGTVVAEVTPVPSVQTRPEGSTREEIFREILERRLKRPVVTQAEWAEWIDEGHRD